MNEGEGEKRRSKKLFITRIMGMMEARLFLHYSDLSDLQFEL